MSEVIKGQFGVPSNKEFAHDLLRLTEFVNRFRTIERSIHFKGVEGRERNGEHAFQLGFTAKQINRRACLGLSNELIGDMADAHDLVEVYAKDTPMFPDVFRGSDDQPNHQDKKDREEAAYRLIEQEFGDRFSFVRDIRTYLDQAIPEATFISALEKLIAVMNIFQDEGRSWRLLCVPIEEADRRHRARVSKHEAVKAWYEEVIRLIWEDAQRRPNFYPEMPAPGMRKLRPAE
jgi:putative hydrolase of HD superfamily